MIFGVIENIVEIHVIELLVLLVVVFVKAERESERGLEVIALWDG